jgi:hypothetical protein
LRTKPEKIEAGGEEIVNKNLVWRQQAIPILICLLWERNLKKLKLKVKK